MLLIMQYYAGIIPTPTVTSVSTTLPASTTSAYHTSVNGSSKETIPASSTREVAIPSPALHSTATELATTDSTPLSEVTSHLTSINDSFLFPMQLSVG